MAGVDVRSRGEPNWPFGGSQTGSIHLFTEPLREMSWELQASNGTIIFGVGQKIGGNIGLLNYAIIRKYPLIPAPITE